MLTPVPTPGGEVSGSTHCVPDLGEENDVRLRFGRFLLSLLKPGAECVHRCQRASGEHPLLQYLPLSVFVAAAISLGIGGVDTAKQWWKKLAPKNGTHTTER